MADFEDERFSPKARRVSGKAERERLLRLLRRGPRDGETLHSKYRIWNASHHISVLRRQGYQISSRKVWRTTVGSYGEKRRCQFAEYTLEKP